MWLQVINKVKVTHQGEGHIKVKVKYLYPFKFYVAHTFCMSGYHADTPITIKAEAILKADS